MTYSRTFNLLDPIIRIETGKGSGQFVIVDVRKIPDNVLNQLVVEGIRKPLTDINKDKEKEETLQMVHERRLKRVANWYNGDFSVRGGGTADPVLVQMKEEIIAVYIKAGLPRKAAEKHVKGTALQFLAEQAKLQDGDEAAQTAWYEASVAKYKAAAEATLKTRSKTSQAIDVSAIQL